MAGTVEAYVIVRHEDEEHKYILGPRAGYATMFEGALIRVYDENATRLINADCIVEMCIPNNRPK